ncbi:PIN domain-like protein, partial [Schizopora paradoxa]
LENMEGKSMAIDSSIWIYQFQATMRDKDGRVLVNAHLVGFLRRICKLLFYGIRPVFVFDGGAPALKRMTISERKKKKLGAAESHHKLAERLLAAQMRREAVNQAQKCAAKGKQREEQVIIDEDTVYLEDLTGPAVPRTPSKEKKDVDTPPSTEKKKNKWRDYDPYKLPDVDMEAAVAKASRASAPDPRLATEDELQAFIDQMRPEDLDVTSPAFRELPTEVQYEIIGDLRLKSRQTSHKRLEAMLKQSKSALDFSRAQILNLKQRNELTQQLLSTTDSMGQAHLTIPVRIAAERNREYVLVKNEGAEGGWILGIRDDGTAEKPIEIDQDERITSDVESDDDMEEISIPPGASADPELREYQREMALQGVSKRQAQAASKGRRKKPEKTKPAKQKPLFIPEEGLLVDDAQTSEEDMDEDLALATAMQASMEDQEEADLQRALEESSKSVSISRPKPISSISTAVNRVESLSSTTSEDDFYATPSRLNTQLKFANTTLALASVKKTTTPAIFSNPTLLTSSPPREPSVPPENTIDSDNDMEEIEVVSTPLKAPAAPRPADANSRSDEELDITPETNNPILPPFEAGASYVDVTPGAERTSRMQQVHFVHDDDVHDEPSPNVNVSEPIEETIPVDDRVSPSPQNELTQSMLVDEPPSDDEIEWSRSPSPANKELPEEKAAENEEHFDAAAEMDPHEEEGEFARFVSQVKGKDLDTVRREIDEEIRTLNSQRKAAMRDSEDVNQAMVAQIMTMLRLFGIPYITAPMEAEAQCAELVSLGLVDGIITDDSDVFLFGGLRVFKNMFNQSKTVECFLLADLARELGLDRDKLVRLAYLLGSDYVEGLAGVGPVVAMELLAEFPGEDGLYKFKDWWLKVQSGRDKELESGTKFRNRFKKRFKELYLAADWPNSAVRDAYYHPVVDSSDEPFKWGSPDLDGLRYFLKDELSWNQEKVDDLLLPIIQKMNKRSQENAMNRQGTLNDFVDIAGGSGTTLEPRKRQAYTSKRLQELVSAHRQEQKRKAAAADDDASDDDVQNAAANSSSSKKGPVKRARKRKSPNLKNGEAIAGGEASELPDVENHSGTGQVPRSSKAKRGSGSRGRGRGRGGKARGGSRSQTGASRKTVDSNSSEDEFVPPSTDAAPTREIKLRERPKPRKRSSINNNSVKESAPQESNSDSGSDFVDT